MISEAVILAGGKGTRLRSVVSDVPKPMADIDGQPFLYHQIRYLAKQGISRVVLSVGYLHQVIEDFFGDSFEGTEIIYVREESPLGTGGGLKLALDACKTDDVLVCNGDTFFEFRLSKLAFVHQKKNAGFTFSVREVENDGRYGGLKISDDCLVLEFIAKNVIAKTFINAGVYLVNKSFFLAETTHLIDVFSLEDDFLAKKLNLSKIFAVPFTDGRFLDIGIPEDYFKARDLIPLWVGSGLSPVDTIFLDRDGVINEKIDGGYVTRLSELKILDGVTGWLRGKAAEEKQFFVITNQRGIGRGIMTEEDLSIIHGEISDLLAVHGVQITSFYHCPDTEKTSWRRKPNPGMLEEAFSANPGLKKETSVLIGDSLTDLQAAGAFGIRSIWLTNGKNIRFEALLWCSDVAETLKDVVL